MDEAQVLVPDVNHFIVSKMHQGPYMEITKIGDMTRTFTNPISIELELQSVGTMDVDVLRDLMGRRVVLLVVPA